MPDVHRTAEDDRNDQDALRAGNWKRWGPYLSERQWGTVREDYSAKGESWLYFPHEQARSRAYRWGEDGLLGICDRQARLCFALALWNGRDPILKERLFGLTGPEGNHGEDVKELYYYLDATPTSSYLRALYKYPQAEFPYVRLLEESRQRGRDEPELELVDTGVFDEGRYFDVLAEYAKRGPEDVFVRLTVTNRGPDAAPLVLMPTLWFRNTWSWGRTGEGYWPKPQIVRSGATALVARHVSLGRVQLDCAPSDGVSPELVFTENETNAVRLFGDPNATPWVKDAFHELVIQGHREAVNPADVGTKAAALYRLDIGAGAEVVLHLRLRGGDGQPDTVSAGAETGAPFDDELDRVFTERIAEADDFYARRIPGAATADERRVARQAYAGLLWSRQFYHYVVKDWVEGDPAQPAPPSERRRGRNRDWRHLYNRDVISMPDKWEYPWYAAWDTAFHMIPFARVDVHFAKEQLILFLREWYQHPNGQLPAYEFALGDVNPPVHAWAVWRVYKMTAPRGGRDIAFLARAFHKLLLNFTWWINRKDDEGDNLFGGGFLGLDNIGVFDRSQPLPTGGRLEQADGTAWMAFFTGTMLSIALELASFDSSYEDVASKFFEHFVAIVDAMNTLGGTGLWDEKDGFYYDQLHAAGRIIPLRTRSMVGIVPLLAVEVLDEGRLASLKGFRKRMMWFIENRPDLSRHISHREGANPHWLLAVPSRERLERVLQRALDENELLSPWGVRSLSRWHADRPTVFHVAGREYRVEYTPGESTSGLFGGNSNWRGPVWFPLNFLLIESLQRYHHFYGETLRVECPTGSGRRVTLDEVAAELAARLCRLFLPGPDGQRPCHGDDPRYAGDPAWKDLLLFHEYFHAETGRGLGASHQTGWTALVAQCLELAVAARGA